MVIRRSVEVTFEEARAHLGLETWRQGLELVIARTTPALLGVVSLVVLLAGRRAEDGQIPLHQTAWYRKAEAALVIARHWCASIAGVSSIYEFCPGGKIGANSEQGT